MGHGSAAIANQVGAPRGFELSRQLGDGAEGGAWAGVDGSDGATVVLKRVPAEATAAVEHAYAVLRRVGSPYLPAVRGLVAADDGASWLVTTWAEGEPLPRGPVDVATAVGDIRAVAHALHALHAAGTHHGDLSPANVVVTPTGPMLVDLGQLGRRGTGTPGCLAPEVLAGGGGPAADRFGVGCLLCWRLFGELPWVRPEALLAVRSAADVRRRVEDLDARGVMPATLGRLLEALLHPDPDRRVASTQAVAERLTTIEEALRDGRPVPAAARWWLPRRWPYRGVDPDDALALLRRGGGALVVVTGPGTSGRGRLADEIVQRLQGEGVAARSFDAERLAPALGLPASPWLEAWLEAPADAGVLAVREPSTPDVDAVRLQAAVEVARVPLVVTLADEVASRLSTGPRLQVVAVAPWSVAEVRAALQGVLEADDAGLDAWAGALHRATGGWPAAVVAAATAAAGEGLEEPDAAAIEAAMAEHVPADPGLDPARARALLQLSWSPDPERARRLPGHWHDGTAPHAAALIGARRILGAEAVRAAAASVLARTAEPTLALAIDADDSEAVARALHRASPADPALVRALQWLERGGAARVPARVLARGAQALLAQGEAGRAHDLVGAVEDPRCRYETARALQRLGRIDDALALLPPDDGTDGVAWRRRGLRWRVLVDRGDAATAIEEAARLDELTAEPDDGDDAVGLAGALLWAGYAALVAGERELARRRFSRAAATAPEAGSEAAGIRARVEQLLGNLAHDEGSLHAATDHYRRATAAFADAGEPVGTLMLRGTLAGLGVPTAEVAVGLEHGRAAVRGLLARGQWDALVEAVLNLVQLLGRVAAIAEAERLLALVEGAVEHHDGALARARVHRIRAEVGVMKIVHRVDPIPTRRVVERHFVDAAAALEAAEHPREAEESWLRAAALARADGRIAVARLHLGRASVLQAHHEPDDAARAALAAEAVRIAADAADEGALEAALGQLRGCGRVRDFLSRGRLELAWAIDRALHCALRRHLAANDPRRVALARRMLTTLEAMMQKAKPIDRAAVRTSVVSEAGDPGALRDLLEELEAPEPAERRAPRRGTRADRADADADRLPRLMRMYRRFAREERLEPLLEQVVDAVMDLTDAERGAVVVRRADGEALEVSRELAPEGDGIKFSRSVIDAVLASGEPVLSVDAAADERFDDSRSISHLNLRSVLAVPLRFRGRVLGAAYVDHRLRRGNFDESDLAHMEEFGELAALAVAHAAALDEVRTQAAKLEAQQAELARLLEVREAEVVALREDARRAPEGRSYRGIVGASSSIRRVFRLIDRLADSDVPVVVYGESGTGKELVARAIHDAGSRGSGPFVAENCGAIPETLLESVLFGHAKGAFTGAQKAKAGLFEAANGGTIFLDEVSEMSPGMQTKLLRVLQEGEIRRVGENTPRPVDVRVIAASNRDLDALVERGEFRRDLFYRIHVVRLDLPALRERVEDIASLVDHFVQRHSPGAALTVTAPAMRALCGYGWPGNVRELENEVQRWLALCEGEVEVEDLSPVIAGNSPDGGVDPDDLRIRPRVERLEKELIARALDQTGNNQTQAAQLLGLSRFGLQKKLKRLAGG